MTLTVVVTGSGSGQVTSDDGHINCSAAGGACSFAYPTGASVNLSAAPGAQALFDGWSGGCSGTGACTLTLDADTSVGASFTQTFSLSTYVASGSGTITSSPAGINCSDVGGGVCSGAFAAGTVVSLSATPASGWAFAGWGGDCSGTDACSVTLDQARSVSASFSGPFDFSLTEALPNHALSLVQGETRAMQATVTVTNGSALPVDLTVQALPAGITASFSPATVTPNGSATLTLTAAADAPLGTTSGVTIRGTSGSVIHDLSFGLTVGSRFDPGQPYGVALEAGGATALVTETSSRFPNSRLLRVDVGSKTILQTVAESAHTLRGLRIEAGGATALVAEDSGLLRVTLAGGAAATVSAGFRGGADVELEAGGATALVTDCGPAGDCSAGRVDRVDLATGALTTLSATGLNQPRALALEAGGGTALVTEAGTGRLLRVNLSSHAVLALASGLDGLVGLALEAGGATALVSSGELYRVNLATGVPTPLGQLPDTGFAPGNALAIEAGGHSAIITYASRVARVDLRYPVTALAPARQSVEVLGATAGVAVEPGGTTALVTDVQPGCSGPCGRILRVGLASGLVTPLATGLNAPHGIAIEPGGQSALVAESGGGRLLRLDLATASLTPLATGLTSPLDVAPEANGTSALVTQIQFPGSNVVRVNLATGSTSVIGGFQACNVGGGLSVEAGGATALLTTSCPSSLLRMDLASGATTLVAGGLAGPTGVAVEPGGATALVAESGGYLPRLLRVDLGTGQFTVLAADFTGTAGGGAPFVALEAGGSALVTEANQLIRVGTQPLPPASVARGLTSATGFALAGSSAYLLDCGGAGTTCATSGRLVRADLGTGAETTVVPSGLNNPSSIALEAGGATALVADCGPSSQDCASAGRVLRVDLATGGLSLVASGLNAPDGIAIEAGDATALVCERGGNRLLRVTLADGSFGVVSPSLPAPHNVVIEAGGATALVAANGVERVNLSDGSSTVVAPLTHLNGFAVEPGGATALVQWSTACCGATAQLGRVDLTSGGVDVLALSYFDDYFVQGGKMLVDASSGDLFFTNNAGSVGTLYRVAGP